MNSLLYYYNNVQKMAAYRQAKRMQRGVKLGYGENPSVSSSTKFTMPPVTIGLSDYSIEYFGNSIGSIGSNPAYMKTSVGVRESGGILAWGYEDGSNGVNIIRFGNTSDGASNQVYPNVKFDNDDPFHLVITRQGNEIKIYVNNELAITWDTREVLDMGDMDLIFANSSDVGFVRVWNMCLSADDVTAHYNNGDPMGYVVPKAMRYFPDVSFLGPDGGLIRQSYTWTNSPEDLNFFRYNFKQDILLGQRLKVQITVSDYEAGYVQLDAAFRGEYYGQTDGIRANGTYVFITNALNSTAYTSYGRVWCVDEGQGRKCTVTVDSVEVVGLFAEYLPQNLMGSRKESIGFTHFSTQNPYTFPGGVSKTMYCYLTRRYILGEGLKMRVKVSDYQSGVTTCVLGNVYHTIPSANGEYEFFSVSKLSPDDPASNYAMIYGSGAMTIEVLSIESVTVPTSWLDSAKQLPLSDECMEPLFQSIGGYDMAANGAPEILYNE
jgi:hypothetical protein